METFARLIGETGRLLGIDGLEPDAEGVVEFASDDADIAVIYSTEAEDVFLMTATAIPLPPQAGDSVLAALKANHGFKATRGCTISLDQEEGRLVLSEYLPLQCMTPESMIAVLERFTSVLLSLRPVLELAVPFSSLLAADGDDISASPEEVVERKIELGDENVTLRRCDDGGFIASSELCDLPANGRDSLLRDLADANYLFAGTAGATFSIDPETNGIWLQQRLWQEECDAGTDDDLLPRRLVVFAEKAAEWKRAISGDGEFSAPQGQLDALSSFIKV